MLEPGILDGAINIRQYMPIVPDHEAYHVISADNTWGRAWDVVVAKGLVKGRKPDVVLMAPIRDTLLAEVNPRIDDPQAALSERIDLSVPILVIPFVGGSAGDHHIIDGWKRVFKALFLEEERLLAHFLSESEERQCRMLDWDIGP